MIPREELEQMYWGQGMSQRKIAELVEVTDVTIGNWMSTYGIKSRSTSESLLPNVSELCKENLIQMYINKRMSTVEISKLIGVSKWTIINRMYKYGIELRTKSEARIGRYVGESNGNWNGGTSFEPYCNKFNNAFKESVRDRDDYTCQLCGYEQKLGGRNLDIHHIHYDKENCYPDVVALCHSCNAKVNGNRDYWEEYFEDLLFSRGMLNWSVNRDLS